MLRIPLSLRTKLAVAFLLVLITVLGLVVYDYFDDYQERTETLQGGQLRTAQAVGAVLEATFDEGVAVGQSLAIDPVVRSLDTARLDPYLASYHPVYPQYESLDVWAANGQNVGASVSLPAGPRPNISDLEHFQRTMATGQPAVSQVMIARTTGRPAIAVIVPIRDEMGRPIGAASVLLDLGVLPEKLRGLQPLPAQTLWAADRTGRLAFLTGKPEMAWEERDASWYSPIQEALAQGQFVGVVDRVLVEGGHRVSAASLTSRYGWVAGVSTAESTLLMEAQRGLAARLGIYLGTIVVAGALAWGFTYAVTRPLRDLASTIAAFGRGERGRRIEVRTGDELETTAQTFNRMASSLQREEDRLNFLVETGTSLASALEVDRVAQLLAERSTQLLGESSWVCVLPREDQACKLLGAYSTDPELHQRLLTLFQQHDEWVAASWFVPTVKSGQPILIRDVASSEMEEGLRRELVALGATSWMVVPMRARGHTVGVLASGSFSEERLLGEEEMALAMDLAGRAGVMIDNALLLRQVEEKASEQERRSNELDAVIEGVSEGITIADGEGRVVRNNSRGREIWHLPEGVGEHPNVRDLAPHIDLRYPDGRPMPFEQWPMVRALGGEVFSGLEVVYHRPDGRVFHLLFASGVVRDEKGGVRLAVNIYGDISPIRELERTREEFISVIAHDLRSPLTVITGFAGLLQRLPPDRHGQPQEHKAIESILSSSKRLEKMVADLLDASRIEAKRLVLTKERVDLPMLVQEVVDRVAEITRGHPVRVEAHGEVPPLQADPTRLEQILTNLLSNAAKYSYPDSEILVEVEPRAEEVVVSVTNQGPGIAPEDREEIFTRFRRTREAAAGKVPGLGLGLYITKGLVEAHGGRIWVGSEMEKTTTFSLTLPVA